MLQPACVLHMVCVALRLVGTSYGHYASLRPKLPQPPRLLCWRFPGFVLAFPKRFKREPTTERFVPSLGQARKASGTGPQGEWDRRARRVGQARKARAKPWVRACKAGEMPRHCFCNQAGHKSKLEAKHKQARSQSAPGLL